MSSAHARFTPKHRNDHERLIVLGAGGERLAVMPGGHGTVEPPGLETRTLSA
jgi:hypothetical protein